MNKRTLGSSLGVLLLGCVVLSSSSGNAAEMPRDFWEKVSKLVEQCARQPYAILDSGKSVFGNLQSECAEIAVDGSKATFQLEGVEYTAFVQESADSDGGDLDDVIVQVDGNDVAIRHNVAAFGDVLQGLAGGTVNAERVFDPRLRGN